MFKRKFSLITLLFVLSFLMVGCEKPISTEEIIGGVRIENVYFSAGLSDYVTFGDMSVLMTYPDSYIVKISYGGDFEFTETIDNRNLYHQYKDREGEIVKAKFLKYLYEDGTIKIQFLELLPE